MSITATGYGAGDRVRVVADDESQYQGHEGTVECRSRYGAFWVRFDSGEREQFAAYRLEPVGSDPTCGQCGHGHSAHRPYNEPGDDEPWSFCSGCGGQCEFVAPVVAEVGA